jgi:hypothetical protein
MKQNIAIAVSIMMVVTASAQQLKNILLSNYTFTG